MTLNCTSLQDLDQPYTVSINQHSEFVSRHNYVDLDKSYNMATGKVLITVNQGGTKIDEFVQTDEDRFAKKGYYGNVGADMLLRNTPLKTLIVNSGSMKCSYPVSFELPNNGTVAQYKEMFARFIEECKQYKEPPSVLPSFFLLEDVDNV